MRYLAIDGLAKDERRAIANYLENNALPDTIDGMYWLQIPSELLAEAQKSHQACAPFFLACELEEERIVFELLVRSKNTLHCPCMCYATKAQRDFLLAFMDALVSSTGIRS